MRRRGNPRFRRKEKNKKSIQINFEVNDMKKAAIPIGIVAFIILFFSVIFSLLNIGNKKIIKGVKIGDIDVSGCSQEEAIEKINNWMNENVLKDINVKYDDFEEDLKVEQYSPEIDTDRLVRDALKVGKTGNIIKDNYQIIGALLFSKKIDLNMNIDNKELDKTIKEINGQLSGALEDSNYYIEENNLIIKKGKTGVVIDENKFKDEFNNSLIGENKKIYIPTMIQEPNEINIENIYNEIYKETKDAYITQNPVEVHPEVNGVDFDITLEEAKNMLNEEKEEYIIPLKITLAETTIEDLGNEAFPHKLGTFSTTYDTSNSNRETNIKLASAKIDETIVLPGEEFSYNKVVGQRTIAAGYKEAAVYSGGKVVDGIGGGICQLSSTLYNAVIYANLEITQRSNHRFLTSYVEAGRDATVSWGTVDFCFINTRNYPIKIETSVKNGVVSVSIYGMKEENEYEIVIENKVDELIPYTVKYVKDKTKDEGTEEIKQFGSNGAKSTTYKVIKSNGAVVSRELLSTDTYSPLERIILKGTKKTEETTSAPMFAQSREEENNEEEVLEEINPGLLDIIKEL